MTTKSLKLLALAFIVFASISFKAQTITYSTIKYVFAADSLKGFDEVYNKKLALNNGCFGKEYNVFMYYAKRNYVNQKYNLKPSGGNSSSSSGGKFGKGGGDAVINAAPCINEDFEATPLGPVTGTLLGWSIGDGQNNNTNGSCVGTGCCPNFPSNNATIVATPLVDAVIGAIPNSPLGGTKIIKMNDNVASQGEIVRITQTFPVTANNALFQFAFVAAFYGAHTCCEQPYIKCTLEDCSANTITCPQVFVVPPGPSCSTVTASGWTTTASVTKTTGWQVKSIDLTPYIGSCITVKLEVGDCPWWGHWGFAYFDCLCSPQTVQVNNMTFPAGSNAFAVTACNTSTATISAPSGLGPYNWNGPGGSGVSNNPNQTFTTSTAGVYTITMNPPGICAPIVKTVTLNFGTNPTAGFTATNSCTTYSFTNTGTSWPTAYQSFSFTGSGAPASFTSTNNVNVVNFPPNTTFTVYQTVINTQSCVATASMVITTPNGPDPSFTAAPSFTQCFNGNSFTFNATTTSGTHTYAIVSGTGVPGPGYTATWGPVSFSATGTYTITHTVNSGGCTTSASSIIVINPNPTVVATYSPPICPGGKGTLKGGGLGSYFWTGPNSYTSNAQNPQIVVTASTTGVYTLTSTYMGCTGTATVAVPIPTFQPITIQNNGPVCFGGTVTFTVNYPAGADWAYIYKEEYDQINWNWYYWWDDWGEFYNQGASNSTSYTASNVINDTLAAGVYTFFIQYPGCAYTQHTTNVQVVMPPTLTVTNTGPYCAGQTIQLNASASSSSVTYNWSGPNSYTSGVQNPNIPNSTTAMSGIYNVTLTTIQASCTVVGSTSVTVNPLPIIVVNSPTVCIGSSINLTASGGTTYNWTGPNSFASAIQNPTITGSTMANAGVYTVSVTLNGCSSTATTNVTVLNPTTTAGNTGPYCTGQTIQLNTPAANAYSWSGPLGFTSNAQNPTIANATTGMSGTYSVIATIGTCTTLATTAVTVHPLPTPTATNTGPYCVGDAIQLNGSSAVSYSWSGPSSYTASTQNGNIPNSTAANAGTYSLSVTDNNGCVNTATTSVVVNPLPVININSNSPVCINTNILLTATGGSTYNWSGPNGFTSVVQNPTITSAALNNSGVYTVTVTTINGCISTATTNVSVLNPTTTASNTGPYCENDPIQLNTSAATSYSWSGPNAYVSNAQNPIIANSTVGMSGTYTVIVSIGTCTALATTDVTVHALPTPVAGNTGPYCENDAIQLNGTAAVSYSWAGPGGFTANTQNTGIATSSLSSAGTYSFSVTDNNGCVNTATTIVVVNPLPVIAVTNPAVCIGDNISLTSNGGVSYSWSGPLGFTDNTQNPIINNATLAMSGQYTVTVTSAQGCTNTAIANVTVHPLPNPGINSNSPVCVNGTLNLNGSGGVVYNWSGPNGFTSNQQNPSINNVGMPAAGVYSLLVSSGTCTASTTATVIINPLPQIAFTNTNVLCFGGNTGISEATVTVGTGPFNYQWSNSQGTQTANNLPAGQYTLTVTDANGCSSSSVTTLTEPSQMSVTINASALSACAGTPINLNGLLSGGAGPYSYSWNPGPTGSSYAVTENIAGDYTYTLTGADANGCQASKTIALKYNPLPIVTATGYTMCIGDGTAHVSALGADSYTWMPGNITGSTYTYTGASSLGLTVIGEANGCVGQATTNIIINPLPVAHISTNSQTGCVPACMVFTCVTSSSVQSVDWDFEDGFSSGVSKTGEHCFNQAGKYNITANLTDNNGCKTSSTYSIEVYPKPIADFNYSPYKPIVNNADVTFTDASYGANIVKWDWYFKNLPKPHSNERHPVYIYDEAGNYAVALVVTSDFGCIDTVIKVVNVGEDYGIYVPNAFTPNGDGYNDVFQPKGFGIKDYEMHIFDRWGEEIMFTNNFAVGWDGTFKGQPCKDDTYVWKISLTNVFGKSHELTGHVTLMK